MADLKIASYITLETADTGDVYANVFTPMVQFTVLLPLDNMFTMNQKNTFGGKIFGLGNQYISGSSIGSVNKLFFYFFNTTVGATLNNEGKIPTFMNSFLDIDESKLVAYATNVNVIDSSKLKQGITKEREGIINTTAPVVGCTMYWPQGYGTGEINAMAVSLVDLSTLKTMSAAEAQLSAVFGGVQFAVFSNYDGYKEQYGCIKPNTAGITTADEIILKILDVKTKYNIKTGDYLPYTDSYPANHDFPFYGCNSVVVGDKMYFVSAYGSWDYRVTELNLTTKTARYGYNDNQLHYHSSAVLIGSEVWFQTARTATAITLKKLDLTTVSLTAEEKIVTLPTYFSTTSRDSATITQFDDGSYGLIDGHSGICYKFTDLTNVAGSITDTYFTGSTAGYPAAPIKNGVNTQFLAISSSGFYLTVGIDGKNNGVLKFILSDGKYGPLLSYNKFETSYNKSATSELTSSFMITL